MNSYIEDFMAVMADVKKQIETGADKFGEGQVGTAYIDWGVSSDIWQNCPNKEIADRVASEMQRGGLSRIYSTYGAREQQDSAGNAYLLPHICGGLEAQRIYGRI